MAPMTTTKTITISLPLKIIAFICGVVAIVLMVIVLGSSDWLRAEGWRQGLFEQCIEENVSTPLPFNVTHPPDCHPARDVVYIRTAAGLCTITLLTDIIATIFTGLGLKSRNHLHKSKYYLIASGVMSLSFISVLTTIVMHPVFLVAEIIEGNRTVWEFGWSYSVFWGAAMFLFGAAILLLFNKETIRIFYKHRMIVVESDYNSE